MVECRLNDASLQDADIRKALRRVRLLYLAFLLIWVVGGIPLIVLPLGAEEVGWTIGTVCYLAFLGFFAVALRYALDYSWARVADRLGVVLCIPVISLILVALLDHRLSAVSNKTSALPARAVRLAEAHRGVPYALLLADLAVLLLVGVIVTASRDSFRAVFQEMVEEQEHLPWTTVCFLNMPLWAFRATLGLTCFALVVKEYAVRDGRWRLRLNLFAALLGLGCAGAYAVFMFGPMGHIITNLSGTS